MPAIQKGDLVAVTGASGFIGSHCVAALLAAGFKVRAVVRNASDETKTAHLRALPVGAGGSLSFGSGDLLKPGSFDDAFAGVDAVMHTAAVVLTTSADPQRDIVDPSVKGTENVLASIAKAKSVQRIVHTSSIAAIINMDTPGVLFTEEHFNTWSTVANGDAYGYAKVSAEKMVEAFARGEAAASLDAISINPCVVVGPCMVKAHTKASPVFIRQLVYGNELPDTWMQFVDVRDVAHAHVAALTATAGNSRFIIAGPAGSHAQRLSQVAAMAQSLYPQHAIALKPLPWWKQLSIVQYFFATEFEQKYLAAEIKVDGSACSEGLGVTYRPLATSLQDTIDSMIDTGFVKPKPKAK